LFEDIFEASDSLPASPSLSDLSSNTFFSHLARDDVTPLLSDRAIRQIIQGTSRVQTSKRRKETDTGAWDAETLGRILRLLQRVVSDAEGVVLFKEDIKEPTKVEKAKKGRATKGNSKSKSPVDTKDSQEVIEDTINEEDLAVAGRYMQRVRSAGLASECVLAILSTEGLPKQVSGST
jgi:hypothetical protein